MNKEAVQREIDYTLYRLRGALMYNGGDFENFDFHEMNVYDLVETCVKNGIEPIFRIKPEPSIWEVKKAFVEEYSN